ncbi:MAG: GDSL-type esterase/lipase family protein [Candidatus Fimimonas sp.]
MTSTSGKITNKRKAVTVVIAVVAVTLALVLLGLILTGLYVGWGPFSYLQFDKQEKTIINKYDATTRQNEIIFYGASNFRLWTEMENDLSDYKVQNHGFGGSTDKDLVERADKLLYPYKPQIVFFQTGSNDYVSLKGTDEEKVAKCVEYKKQMFSMFHEKLPDSYFVVMGGLLLPGRSQYAELTKKINYELKTLCESTDYLFFVNAEEMTFDGTAYKEELFVSDGIHLNHYGQLLWCNGYIKPQISAMIEQYRLEGLTNDK